ncbi:lactose transport protein [Agrilactobacillus composti DSM 18527 = JCM 14202]|uniref:Lactose transport protein n=1 Tax=Agrilactobacillus composti DSM 18527 = JCM 14202 TaxID=1423734 RepID=X0PFM3_9LACO|nr:glycoside-pentoside-hexuronide (GPH):cation symporter [Agrilactobacillus composti]KRM33424.1 lactose transport protein [Agrilactobacillus composti DSM 18527 = JCM 14202]GAF40759.1 lactose and galactose permease [Agrilactobacillus composti DSM 18527 = JCM 14202]
MSREHATPSKYKQRISYTIGEAGHDMAYNMMANLFIIYATTSLFAGLKNANQLIALLTSSIVVIRLCEIFFDPLIAGFIDNRKTTRFGKFRPWAWGATILHSLLLIVLYSGFLRFLDKNYALLAATVIVFYALIDLIYTVKDTSFAGMVPALSVDSKERGIITSYARIGAALGGGDIVPLFMIPAVVFFTYLMTGQHQQGIQGWFWLGLILAIYCMITMTISMMNVRENTSIIRESRKRANIKDIFKSIFQNDQLMWVSLTYLIFAIGNVTSKPSIFYVYNYVLARPTWYWVVGAASAFCGIFSVPFYPILCKWISRKRVYLLAISGMLLAELLFIFSGKNLVLVVIATVLFFLPQQLIALVTMMIAIDSIEYEQLKHGIRNEAVTVSVHGSLDKIAGSLSSGIVGFIVIAANMSNANKATDLSTQNIQTFHLLAFVVPAILMVISLIIFLWKVKLTEEKHAQIVDTLSEKLTRPKVVPERGNN